MPLEKFQENLVLLLVQVWLFLKMSKFLIARKIKLLLTLSVSINSLLHTTKEDRKFNSIPKFHLSNFTAPVNVMIQSAASQNLSRWGKWSQKQMMWITFNMWNFIIYKFLFLLHYAMKYITLNMAADQKLISLILQLEWL